MSAFNFETMRKGLEVTTGKVGEMERKTRIRGKTRLCITDHCTILHKVGHNLGAQGKMYLLK